MPIPSIQYEADVLSLVGQLKKVIISAKNEFINLFEIGLEDYLLNQAAKFLEVNTFLHQDSKVNFLEIYFPVSISDLGERKKVFFDKPIGDLAANRFVAILGNAGSGKSTLTKYIYLRCITENRKIPVLIELRHLNDEIVDFENYLNKKLLSKGIKPSENTLHRAMQDGLFLFILDGFDELYSNKLQSIVENIDDFIDKYRNNHFVITSRPGAGAERLPRFKAYKMNNLSTPEVVSFVQKMVNDTERQHRILDIIRSPESVNYINFLKNPLLLSMFILTFKNYPIIPKKKYEFYRNVFDTLYSKHDGVNKNSYPREIKSFLDKDSFEKLISILAYRTYFKGQYVFVEELLSENLRLIRRDYSQIGKFDEDKVLYDLITSISILVKEGILISFPHRSLQEYFTANFVCTIISDDIQKKAVYDIFNKQVVLNSQDGFSNFWDLCTELDMKGFYTYCTIPKLKEIHKKLEGINDKEILMNFFKFWGIIFKVKKDEERRSSLKKINGRHVPKRDIKLGKVIPHVYFLELKITLQTQDDSYLAYFDIFKNFKWFFDSISDGILRKRLEDYVNENFKYFGSLSYHDSTTYDYSLSSYTNKDDIDVFHAEQLYLIFYDYLIVNSRKNRIKLSLKNLSDKIEDLEIKVNSNYIEIDNIIRI